MRIQNAFSWSSFPPLISILLKLVAYSDSAIQCSLVEPSNCDCVKISESPQDTSAVYGSDVLLQCRVEGVSGKEVQWTKDGVGLGNEPQIPGYPRYSMTDNAGNTLSGNYDLIVTTVELEDEGKYQCQVINCQNVQSNVVALLVLVPPYGPVITDEKPNGEYRVVVDQTIHIQCEAWNAKPAADVSWYKGNDQITEGVTKKTNLPTEMELYNSSATLQLKPNLTDDQAIYTCVMNNDALIAENPNVISAQKNDISLVVLVPPEAPTIDNFNPIEGTVTVQEEYPFTIVCRTENGKPVPILTWYRENVALNSTVVYEISPPDVHGRQNVTAILQGIGNITDDDARFTCSVENEALEKPMTISFILQVSTPLNPVVIAVIVLGGIIFLFLLIFLIIYLFKRRKDKMNDIKQAQNDEQEEVSVTSSLSTSTKSSSKISELQKSEISVVSSRPEEILVSFTNPMFGSTDQSYSDDTTLPAFSSVSSSEKTDSEMEQDATPPGGDVFSLSSSMRRSDRGSPVDFIDEDFEILSLPTLQNDSWSLQPDSLIHQAYVMRSPTQGLVTTV